MGGLKMPKKCSTCEKKIVYDSNIGEVRTYMHSPTVKLMAFDTRSNGVVDVTNSAYQLKPGPTCVNCMLAAIKDGVEMNLLDSPEYAEYMNADGFGDRICYLDSECAPL